MTESRENWYLDLRSKTMNQDCHVLCRRHDFTALKKKKENLQPNILSIASPTAKIAILLV